MVYPHCYYQPFALKSMRTHSKHVLYCRCFACGLMYGHGMSQKIQEGWIGRHTMKYYHSIHP